MSDFNGVLANNIITGFPSDRALFLGDFIPLPVADGWVFDDSLGGGAFVDNTPVSIQAKNNIGYFGGSYNDIFYNRILIEPSVIDLGNIVVNENYIINVWNAYFTNVTLQTILETSTNGLIITGPPLPTNYTPLLEQQYALSISVDGPAAIEAVYKFDFAAPTEDRSIKIIGNRLVLLPYWFSSPVTERLMWLTNILETRNGTEQRIRLRAAPRQQFSVSAYANRDEVNRAENILYGWRSNKFAIPIWSEARQVTSTVTKDDSSIQVDTKYADFRVNELAIIWKNNRDYDVFRVVSFTTTQITLSRGVNDNYPIGTVAPVRFARLLGDPSRRSDGVSGYIDASFEVITNQELTTVTPVQFLGEDVNIDDEALLDGNQLIDTYKKRMVVIDYETGVPAFSSPWDDTRINREYKLLLEGAKQIWDFRRWLHRRAGRAIPFYMPTQENNIRLVQKSGSVTTPLVAYDDEQRAQGIKRTHLAINTKTSGWLFRVIIGQGINVDGHVEIAIDVPVNEDISDILFISYMGLKRLASDRIEIRHLQNFVAEVNIPITEIQP